MMRKRRHFANNFNWVASNCQKAFSASDMRLSNIEHNPLTVCVDKKLTDNVFRIKYATK